ncbi:MAG: flagellar basal-body rod protein FlgG [Alphaproteobacteria bacterium]|nr:flagellar basal-body rod protein FlgG [Alphaproteobacteria bacterium]
MRSLSIAATGLQAQQLHVEVISNNIANINTNGFKRQEVEFQDLLYQNVQRAGTNTSDSGTVIPAGIQLGLGVNAGSVYRIFQQGTMNLTGGKYDVAIQGRGFFKIELPTGDFAYTRAGSFQPNTDGDLVTPEGYKLSPGINIPGDTVDVTISPQGEVSVLQMGQNAATSAGKIDFQSFINEAGLEGIGDNLFRETAASGPPIDITAGDAGAGTFLQGYLEASNVDPVTELTNLITAQRGYEFNSKVISASDDMMKTINEIRN